jgi:hypothetical protein
MVYERNFNKIVYSRMSRLFYSTSTWLGCLVFVFWSLALPAQEEGARWSFSMGYGQYGARLAVPDFSVYHPGGEVGIHYQWNRHQRHQLVQSGMIGFFAHPDFQMALQCYSEFGYHWRFAQQWTFSPLNVGGGYVASFGQLEGHQFDPQTQQYEATKSNLRHNWLIGLGSGVTYHSPLNLWDRPIDFGLRYRLQVQGVVVRETVPVIAYSPLLFIITLPIR